jgi:hypothetical protein
VPGPVALELLLFILVFIFNPEINYYNNFSVFRPRSDLRLKVNPISGQETRRVHRCDLGNRVFFLLADKHWKLGQLKNNLKTTKTRLRFTIFLMLKKIESTDKEGQQAAQPKPSAQEAPVVEMEALLPNS